MSSAAWRPASATSREGAVFEVSQHGKRLAIVGTLVGLVLGTLGVVLLVIELAGDRETGQIVAGVVLALVFLTLGVACARIWLRMTRSCRLTIEQQGVRLAVPKRQFAVPWTELRGVGISWTTTTTSVPDGIRATTRACHLDLFPGDDGFRARHPEMEHYWGRRMIEQTGYRVLLGDVAEAPRLEAALTRFAPRLYLGVHEVP